MFSIVNVTINIHASLIRPPTQMRGVRKIRNFQPISRRISETVQDSINVAIND